MGKISPQITSVSIQAEPSAVTAQPDTSLVIPTPSVSYVDAHLFAAFADPHISPFWQHIGYEPSYIDLRLANVLCDPDTLNRYWRDGSRGNVDMSDNIALNPIKNFADPVSASESMFIHFNAVRTDGVTVTDALVATIIFIRDVTDSVTPTDAVVLAPSLAKADTTFVSEAYALSVSKVPTVDTVNMSDDTIISVSYVLSDIATPTEVLAKDTSNLYADTTSLSDDIAKSTNSGLADGATAAEDLVKAMSVAREDSAAVVDAPAKDISKPASETLTITEALAKNISTLEADAATISESLQIVFVLPYSSVINGGPINTFAING